MNKHSLQPLFVLEYYANFSHKTCKILKKIIFPNYCIIFILVSIF